MVARVRAVLATFGWWQWLLTAVFVFALILATMFTARTVRSAIFWRLHHQEPIARWMTVNYVAHSYNVPPDVLWKALGLPEPRPPVRPDRRPLGDIANAQGKTFEAVVATLQDAIANWHPEPPPPPGGPPPTTNRGGP